MKTVRLEEIKERYGISVDDHNEVTEGTIDRLEKAILFLKGEEVKIIRDEAGSQDNIKTSTALASPWIEPERFVERMEEVWTSDPINNVSSEALRKTWGQLAVYFQRHIQEGSKRKYYVLSPPTGAGKTLGTIVYASMLADLEPVDHPGMLIVTRLQADCDRIAQEINRLSDSETALRTALAYHSAAPRPLDELRLFPVLVICHEAYKNAVGLLSTDEGSHHTKWPYFTEWMLDSRRLTVIDECIDIVEDAAIDLDGIRATLGIIPQTIRDRFKADVTAIESVIETLEQINEKVGKNQSGSSSDRMLRDGQSSQEAPAYFKELAKALHDADLDPDLIHEERLKGLSHIIRNWSYYQRRHGINRIHSARMLIPEDDRIQGGVIMDATAGSNNVYRLHRDSELVSPPEGSRTYRNFTLHVSKGHKVGRKEMKNNALKTIPQLMKDLTPRLKGKKVLIISHKDVEPIVQGCETDFELHTGHWGAVDGSNEWKDCEAVVILGLPYLPDHWYLNRYMALQGPQDTDWLRGEGKTQKENIKRGKLASDVVQALNRVRSRKVINDDGDCKPTEGFILFPADKKEADALREDIQTLMPDIVIDDSWKFKGQERKIRVSNYERMLISYLRNMTDRKVNQIHVQKVLGMSRAKMFQLLNQAQDPSSELFNSLNDLGVRIEKRREGRSFKTFFIKNI